MTETTERLCSFCKLPMPATARAHARTCSSRCRQALYRSRQLAVSWAARGRRTPEELFRLQLAKAEDAPPPMRTRGASFWACRCGTLVAVADVSCRFCGCRRPAGYLLDELDGLLAAAGLEL